MLTEEELATVFPGRRIVGVDKGAIKSLEQSDINPLTVRFDDDSAGEETLLVKHVDVLSQKSRIQKTEEKWAISVRSFNNEYLFYKCADPEALQAAGVHVPRCLYKARTSDAQGHLQTSTLLLEYLGPTQYVQHHELTFAQATTALAALARFHAYHWTQQGIVTEVGLFAHGGWWRPELRPSVKYDTIAESFALLCKNMPREFAALDTPANHTLMQKLQVQSLTTLPAQVRAKGRRTLVHGDCKTSNLFFSRGDDTCSLIDFQWTGAAASGGGDVAYLLWSGIDVESVRRKAELLDHYYAVLRAALPADVAYSREEMDEDYRLEFLAYFATALPQLLHGIDQAYCDKWRGTYGWLTCECIPAVTAAFVAKALSVVGTI